MHLTLDLLSRVCGGLSIAAYIVYFVLDGSAIVFADGGEVITTTCVTNSCDETADSKGCVKPGATCDNGAPCKCQTLARGCACKP
jgi:hypothetical protein